jgi:CO dehydrogenase maturation factor
MSLRIAVAGKGGTGKTTIAAGLVRMCLEDKAEPVLAVDADPNCNLAMYLGLDEPTTLAEIREEQEVPQGMSKPEYMSLRVQQCLAEGAGVDLITMGRPEGPGCYCAVNHLLRNELSKLQNTYPVVVMDNEAGMEHLSRRTTDDVDVLLVVLGPDKASAIAAQRIMAMIPHLKIRVGAVRLVAARCDAIPEAVTADLIAENQDGIILIPDDPAIKSMAARGETIFSLPSDSIAIKAIRNLWKTIHQEETIDS